MDTKTRMTRLGLVPTTTCGVAATLLTVIFSWTFVASTQNIGWLGSAAVAPVTPATAGVGAALAPTWT